MVSILVIRFSIDFAADSSVGSYFREPGCPTGGEGNAKLQ